ncbi:MAG: potassium-transporting ATPase subunit KdpC [bacterium]|nr:potassium-transporting ATPase subunit KdpC [bacterium]
MANIIRPAVGLFVGLSVLTGLLYPLVTTGIAQGIFPQQANGSLITENRRIIGSELIGQAFTKPAYFWSRPSATAPAANNGMSSGGSNMATGNPALLDAVKARMAELKKYPVPAGDVPVDLVTASASGLDPHISPAAALYQVPRIAAVRGIAAAQLRDLITASSEMPSPRFSGEPRVNVLALNRALDKLAPVTLDKPAGS